MQIPYATREMIKDSLDIKYTSRSNALIDRRILSASQSAEEFLHRKFYPEIRTQTYDWPNHQYAYSWELWLDQHEVISVSSLTSGGVAISSGNYILRPDDGPPFNKIELKRDTSSAFGGGTTPQRDISVAGLHGYKDVTSLAGEVAVALNSSVTSIDLKPLSNILDVGVGSLIVVGTERLLTTNRLMIDTTQNLQVDLTSNMNNTTVVVGDGSTFALNEIILLDSERMKVVDISGNNLTVIRAFDGTTLAVHVASDIYAPRRFVVQRGVLGTTAASHSIGDDVLIQEYPAMLVELVVTETVVLLEQNSAAYASSIGRGETSSMQSTRRAIPGAGLPDIRERTWIALARKSRLRAI